MYVMLSTLVGNPSYIQELYGRRNRCENLIVLCPNCHTRVHQSGIPTKEELRHYKLKQDLAHGLPAFGLLKREDKNVIKYFSELPDDQLSVREMPSHYDTPAENQEQARILCKKAMGLYLQESGITSLHISMVGIGDRETHRVNYRVHLTPKGIGWIRYLKAGDKVALALQ